MTNQEQSREALIRHIADLEAVIRRRNEQIDNQAHNARETQQALEQIARERDEALRTVQEVIDSHDETLRDIASGKYAAESRPLTPDAITDEMVERGAIANWRGDVAHPDWTFEDISDEDRGWYRDNARAVLTAALTEPPARPEGAEDIEALVLDYKRENAHRGYSEAEIADYVAARLTDPTRKEA